MKCIRKKKKEIWKNTFIKLPLKKFNYLCIFRIKNPRIGGTWIKTNKKLLTWQLYTNMQCDMYITSISRYLVTMRKNMQYIWDYIVNFTQTASLRRYKSIAAEMHTNIWKKQISQRYNWYRTQEISASSLLDCLFWRWSVIWIKVPGITS